MGCKNGGKGGQNALEIIKYLFPTGNLSVLCRSAVNQIIYVSMSNKPADKKHLRGRKVLVAYILS